MLKTLLLKRWFIFGEFLLMCIALPSVIIIERLAPSIFLFLWGSLSYCVLVFWVIADDDMRVWRFSEVRWEVMRPIIMRFLFASVGMLIFTYLYDPDLLFALPQQREALWVKVMLFYPILSALPQEFIFCTYFFIRYQWLFPSTKKLVIASTVVFAYAHVLFINPVAPVLSLIAGYFFASTYANHRSLAVVGIEHALYGNVLFTVGLGWYFYGGALVQP